MLQFSCIKTPEKMLKWTWQAMDHVLRCQKLRARNDAKQMQIKLGETRGRGLEMSKVLAGTPQGFKFICTIPCNARFRSRKAGRNQLREPQGLRPCSESRQCKREWDASSMMILSTPPWFVHRGSESQMLSTRAGTAKAQRW